MRSHDLGRRRVMAEPNDLQRKYKEFLDLMPLTLALAGLPASDHGKYFTAEQIESRLFTLRHAWKAARQITRECIQPSNSQNSSSES
jgi:hypothetical protein